MPWRLEAGGHRPRLVLTGHVDIFEASALHEAMVLLAAERRTIHVDLSTCSDLDASALQLLVAFKRARLAAGAPVVFEWGDGRVSRLLSRLGFDQLLRGTSPPTRS